MRIIHYSNHDGTREGVYITEDKTLDANDILPPSCNVDSDFEVDDEFPASFPLDTNLEK